MTESVSSEDSAARHEETNLSTLTTPLWTALNTSHGPAAGTASLCVSGPDALRHCCCFVTAEQKCNAAYQQWPAAVSLLHVFPCLPLCFLCLPCLPPKLNLNKPLLLCRISASGRTPCTHPHLQPTVIVLPQQLQLTRCGGLSISSDQGLHMQQGCTELGRVC